VTLYVTGAISITTSPAMRSGWERPAARGRREGEKEGEGRKEQLLK